MSLTLSPLHNHRRLRPAPRRFQVPPVRRPSSQVHRALEARKIILSQPAWVRALLYLDLDTLRCNPKLPSLCPAIETMRRQHDVGRAPSVHLQQSVLKKTYRHFVSKYRKWLRKTQRMSPMAPALSPTKRSNPGEASPTLVLEQKYFHQWPDNPFVSQVGFADVVRLATEL